MKAKLLSLALVLVMVAALFGAPSQVQATGYGTKFATSITYQNVGDLEATISIQFYSANSGTPITITRPNLPKNAGSSLFVGSLTEVGTGFQGSAMMISNQPMVAVLVQVPQAPSTVKNRPLSIGLSNGAAAVLVPTVLKGVFSTNTIFVVQNADTVANDLVVNFIPAVTDANPNPTPIVVTVDALPPGAAQYYDLSTMAEIPAGFNGSVAITATEDANPANPGSIVATSMELATNSDNVYAFEGTSVPGTTLYMPSAFCKYRGGTINSAYAVQNTSLTTPAEVSVVYTSSNAAAPGTYTEGPYTVAPGGKKSLLGCTVAPVGFIGSAVISATGGQIVGIGKVSGNGISSSFNGLTTGASKVALPYIRWTETEWLTGVRQRANVAIQNVGAPIADTDAITVTYYDRDGNVVGVKTLQGPIPTGGKVNSNPKEFNTEFGWVSGSNYGGGAVVEGPAGSQLAVIVRVETYNLAAGAGSLGEDYNGIPVSVP